MSLILKQFLRDPRPLSRALRRFEDDWFADEWPARKIRRRAPPVYDSPLSMVDMSRQMANTFNRMQDILDEVEALDELASRLEDRRMVKGRNEAVVKRTESGGLQLALDVADFKPEDLKIKLVDDNLLIEAESESSGKDSYRKSHFKRWFKLPEDCKVEEIKSRITEDDRLLIDLPLSKPIESNTRTIPIEVEKKKAVTNGGENQENEATNTNHDSNEQARQRASRR